MATAFLAVDYEVSRLADFANLFQRLKVIGYPNSFYFGRKNPGLWGVWKTVIPRRNFTSVFPLSLPAPAGHSLIKS